MLKGVNKLIIEINNPNSQYFERAIFFVRPSKNDTAANDFSKDADLILSDAEIKYFDKSKNSLKRFTVFLLCLGVGAISAGVTLLFTS